MRTFLAIALASCLGVPAAIADHPQGATREDLRQLQSDLERLDDTLASMDTSAANAREYQRRADRIRDDVTELRDQIRRHEDDGRDRVGASYEDVQRIRTEIVDLRRDVQAADGRGTVGRTVSVPDGTEIAVRLEEPLSSKTARREDRVEATVADSVRVDGRLAIPAGTEVRGTIREVEPAERPARGGKLEIAFETLVMDDGSRVDLRSRIVDVKEDWKNEDTGKRAGLGAILGGVLGGLVKGKEGLIIGAVLGGTGAVVASKGDEVELPAGTVLTLELERPLVVATR